MTESDKKSNRSGISLRIGCLYFPFLFFSLLHIGMFILSVSSEEIYKPGEVPDSGFSVLVRIPGYDRLNNNEVTRWGWSTDEKDYLDERHPGWSFYEPATSDSIKTGEFSFIRWSVEEGSTNRKRIDLEWGDDDGSLFNTYEIENNQITPVSRKIGLHPGFAFGSAIPALIISIILCLLLERHLVKASGNMPPKYPVINANIPDKNDNPSNENTKPVESQS